jgi:transposase
VGDKAYSFGPLRAWARQHRLRAYLPQRKDQRPPPSSRIFDREAYRLRTAIERLVGRLKEWRAVATRFDKLAVQYLATVDVALIGDFLRLLHLRHRA